jgi:hypothetical protein
MKASLILILALSAAACSKQEPPAPAAPPAPSAAPAATPAPVASAAAAAPSASAASNDEVPIEEDFEDEASQQVNAKTLDAQLDALEKEIQSD